MEIDTGGAHIPALTHLYILYVHILCTSTHTPISLSDKLIKGEVDEF